MRNEKVITAPHERNCMRDLEIEDLGRELNQGRSIANKFFDLHNKNLSLRINARLEKVKSTGEINDLLAKSRTDLMKWSKKDKKHTYTEYSLMLAKISRDVANQYEAENISAILTANALHQAAVAFSFNSNNALFQNMIKKGDEGKKLGIVEMADRLGPVLQPAESSKYYHIKYVPYGFQSRVDLGELNHRDVPLVSAETAEKSAFNLIKRFGVHYALTETSAAPRLEVPKSGRKPELYVCMYRKGEKPLIEKFEIETLLRLEFDSRVREIMYFSLNKLFSENDN